MKLVRDAFRDAVRMPDGVDVAQEAGHRVEQAAGLVDGHSSFSSRTWRSIFSGGADDELLESVRAVCDAGKSAHAGNVRVELGDIPDDGGYFDVMDVADDLAELESLGKLSRAPAGDWDYSGPTPETRIAYRPS
jgi:hypothetical protein